MAPNRRRIVKVICALAYLSMLVFLVVHLQLRCYCQRPISRRQLAMKQAVERQQWQRRKQIANHCNAANKTAHSAEGELDRNDDQLLGNIVVVDQYRILYCLVPKVFSLLSIFFSFLVSIYCPISYEYLIKFSFSIFRYLQQLG